jgi:uncharacterized protein YjbJ (UPF0337 family)
LRGGLIGAFPAGTDGYAAGMGLLDKITGRAKKAAGDLADDPGLRRQGSREEEKGIAKDKLAEAQERVEENAKDVADLDRKT